MIVIKELTVSYDGENLVLDRVSLTIEQAGIVGIIGPNGAGKSTLMKSLLHFLTYQGQIFIKGVTGAASRDSIAYVEQKSQIDTTFPITVRDCVSLGCYKSLGLFKSLSKADWQRVDEVLNEVGLLEVKNRPISALSGGQFQRMLLARCLIQNADILLLDEPFVGIDQVSEGIIINLLRQLRAAGKLIVIVHHDLSKVAHYFDQLIILNKELIAYGAVKEVYTPANLKRAYGDFFVTESEVGHA